MKLSRIFKNLNRKIQRFEYFDHSAKMTGLTKSGCIKASYSFIRNLKNSGIGKYKIDILPGNYAFDLYDVEEGGEYEHIRFYFSDKLYDYMDIYHEAYFEDILKDSPGEERISGKWGLNNPADGIHKSFKSLEELVEDIQKNPSDYRLRQ